MAVDSEKYAEALEDILMNVSLKKDISARELQKELEDICHLFGIVRIERVATSKPEEAEGNPGTEIAPEMERVVKNIIIVYRKLSEEGNLIEKNEEKKFSVLDTEEDGQQVEYDFYQEESVEEWTKGDKNKLMVLARVFHSVFESKRLQKINEELTFRDMELDMFNQAYFLKELDRMLQDGSIAGYDVCYFNIKRFSTINQQFGREVGTHIMLIYVAQLQMLLSEDEIICRVSGDNFVVLYYKEHFQRIREYLKEAFVMYDDRNYKRMKIESAAGCYEIPEDTAGLTAAKIMDDVGLAAQVANESVESVCLFYSEELIEKYKQSKRIIGMFQDALENEEFLVFYQPKIALNDYHILGAEALCRWYHEGELVSPDEFIPVLEQGKAICELDFYMLEHVCQDIRRWLKEGKEVVKVSVNLSRRHMTDMDLLDRILSLVDKYEVPHEYLEIELTETTTDVEFRDLKKIVFGLQEAGISTSVDDFGVGYSSLNLIKELPWDVLKIDKSFLPMTEDPDSQEYVMFKHLVAMAQDLGLECIVEGVETLEQVQLLKKNNCFLAQGFYFDRPLPAGNFEKRLVNPTEETS